LTTPIPATGGSVIDVGAFLIRNIRGRCCGWKTAKIRGVLRVVAVLRIGREGAGKGISEARSGVSLGCRLADADGGGDHAVGCEQSGELPNGHRLAVSPFA